MTDTTLGFNLRCGPVAVLLTTAGVCLAAFLGGAGQQAVAAPEIGEGIYTSAQARRGGELYELHCAECHLPNLMGQEPSPPLAGAAFISKWLGMSVGALFTNMSTTMPVRDPGILTHDEYAALLAFVLEANSFPAGDSELTSDQTYLDGIKIRKN